MIQKNFLTKDSDKATKEQQITYLKEHEQEMTDYVKSQNSKVTSVQWDWDSIEVETIGNGTPQGGGKALTIYAKFNDITDSSIGLWFETNKKGLPQISSIELDDNFRVGGNLYE